MVLSFCLSVLGFFILFKTYRIDEKPDPLKIRNGALLQVITQINCTFEKADICMETVSQSLIKKIIPLIVSLLFFSCNHLPDKKVENGIPCEDPTIPVTVFSSSISSSNYKGHEFPACFEAAFSDSSTLAVKTECGTTTYSFQTLNLGKIRIESGKIIACDPIVLSDAVAFTNLFPTGDFDVQLSVTQDSSQSGRVAYSRILFSNAPVNKWVYVVRDNQREVSIRDTIVFLDCSGADAGQALYIDTVARAKFNLMGESEWTKAFSHQKWYDLDFYGTIHKFESHSLAAFGTGHGDGCYGSFIGFDVAGNICRLLTDFQIIIWWKQVKG